MFLTKWVIMKNIVETLNVHIKTNILKHLKMLRAGYSPQMKIIKYEIAHYLDVFEKTHI